MSNVTGIDSGQGLRERYDASGSGVLFGLFAAATSGVMALAWWSREARYLQAESGLGYLLGIVGASLMLLLLLYPLRKRMSAMASWGSLGGWFRLHMMLGILGPCCILLHSNFQLGSTNSTVALLAMLLVAGSGLAGRYLYGKFHYGLYGEKIRLAQLHNDLEQLVARLGKALGDEQSRHRLELIQKGCREIVQQQREYDPTIRSIRAQRRWIHEQKLELRQAGRDHEELAPTLQQFASLLDRLAGLQLFERLFSLWHVLHIPIFVLMVIAAIVHVFVVHWY